MKRTLVAATAVALLLTGCATGENGHLDPDIDPDLFVPSSNQGGGGGGDDDGGDAGAGDDTAAATDVLSALVVAARSESWVGDVTGVEVDGDVVVVRTLLTAAGRDATAVCEVAAEAAQTAGLSDATVEVRMTNDEVISEGAVGGEACSG